MTKELLTEEESSFQHAAVGDSRSVSPSPNPFLPVKELNAKLALIKYLVQDPSLETMPQWVSFNTTNYCNLKCPHCQTHGTEEVHKINNDKRRRWSDETLREAARETLPFAYEFNLTLTGEPLCSPHLEGRLDELGQYGAKLDMNTNGTLFSEEMLCKVLPHAGTITISIDGATKATCEAIRLGVDFGKLLNNIRLLTRCCELLSARINPVIRFAFTIMASNIRDLPEIVRLAHFLRVPTINFNPVVVFYPNLRNEDVHLHKALFNAYYHQAVEEASRLGVAANLPPPYPGVAPDASAQVERVDVIVKDLPEDYYDKLTPFESFLDNDAIEAKATRIAATVEENMVNASDDLRNVLAEALHTQLRSVTKVLLDRYRPELEKMAENEETINFCENLYNRAFVNTEGDVAPCCIPGRPVLGNMNSNSLGEIWNGKAYSQFRREFFSENIPDCCKKCRFVYPIPKRDLLTKILLPR